MSNSLATANAEFCSRDLAYFLAHPAISAAKPARFAVTEFPGTIDRCTLICPTYNALWPPRFRAIYSIVHCGKQSLHRKYAGLVVESRQKSPAKKAPNG